MGQEVGTDEGRKTRTARLAVVVEIPSLAKSTAGFGRATAASRRESDAASTGPRTLLRLAAPAAFLPEWNPQQPRRRQQGGERRLAASTSLKESRKRDVACCHRRRMTVVKPTAPAPLGEVCLCRGLVPQGSRSIRASVSKKHTLLDPRGARAAAAAAAGWSGPCAPRPSAPASLRASPSALQSFRPAARSLPPSELPLRERREAHAPHSPSWHRRLHN
jgi:hypothetical protein